MNAGRRAQQSQFREEGSGRQRTRAARRAACAVARAGRDGTERGQAGRLAGGGQLCRLRHIYSNSINSFHPCTAPRRPAQRFGFGPTCSDIYHGPRTLHVSWDSWTLSIGLMPQIGPFSCFP